MPLFRETLGSLGIWNEPSDNFSEKPEIFLSHVEVELFEITKEPNCYFNVSLKDWRAIRISADNLFIVILKTDKVSCIVVCDSWLFERDRETTLG